MPEVIDKKKAAEEMAARDKKKAKAPVVDTGKSTIYGRVPIPMQGADTVAKAPAKPVAKSPALDKALSRVGSKKPTPETPSGLSLTSDTSGESSRRMAGLKSMQSNYGSPLAQASQRIATVAQAQPGVTPATAPLGYPSTMRELRLPAMSLGLQDITAKVATPGEQQIIAGSAQKAASAETPEEASRHGEKMIGTASQAAGITPTSSDIDEAKSLMDDPEALSAATADKDSSAWDIPVKLAAALMPAITALAGYAMGGRQGAMIGGAAGFEGMAKGAEMMYKAKLDALKGGKGWQKGTKMMPDAEGKQKAYLIFSNPESKKTWMPTDDKGNYIEQKDSISALDLLAKRLEAEAARDEAKNSADIKKTAIKEDAEVKKEEIKTEASQAKTEAENAMKIGLESLRNAYAVEKDQKKADQDLLANTEKLRAKFLTEFNDPARVDEMVRLGLGPRYKRYLELSGAVSESPPPSGKPGQFEKKYPPQKPAAPVKPFEKKPKNGKPTPTENQEIESRMSIPDKEYVKGTTRLVTARRGALADISGTLGELGKYKTIIDNPKTTATQREDASKAYTNLASFKLKQFNSMEGKDALQTAELQLLASELRPFQTLTSPTGAGLGRKLTDFHRKLTDAISGANTAVRALESNINKTYDKYRKPSSAAPSLRTIRIKKDSGLKPGQVFPMAGAKWKMSADGKTAIEVK